MVVTLRRGPFPRHSKPSNVACPACSSPRSSVKDSRPNGAFARRRRVCESCAHRFTTIEVPEELFNGPRLSREALRVATALTEVRRLFDTLHTAIRNTDTVRDEL